MYLHVGAGTAVRQRELIAIFDLRAMSTAMSKEYMAALQNRREVEDISGGDPASLVVTDDRVYLSAISPSTLRRRVAYGHSLAIAFAQGGTVSE